MSIEVEANRSQIRLELLRMFGDKMNYEGLDVMAKFVLEGIIPPPVPAPKAKPTKKPIKKVKK